MIRILRKARRPPKTDSRERGLANLFLYAIREAGKKTSVEELVQALETRDVPKAVAAVRWDAVQDILGEMLPKRQQAIFDTGHDAGAGQLKRVLRKAATGYGFGHVNPFAVRWAQERAGLLITEWGASSRESLTALIVQALEDGIPTRQLARLIIEDGIGLTKRQVLAIEHRRAQLVADAGVAGGKIDRIIDRYSAQLLRERAETIARTEVTEAYIQGQKASWTDAIDEGLLEPTAVQRWDATGGCEEICAPLDGQTARMSEEFAPGIYGPPAHPNCRCNLSIVP
jgi:hypothetical protein